MCAFFFLSSNKRANSCLAPEHCKIVEQTFCVCVVLFVEKRCDAAIALLCPIKGLCSSPGLGYRVTDTSPSPSLCDQHFSSAEKWMRD